MNLTQLATIAAIVTHCSVQQLPLLALPILPLPPPTGTPKGNNTPGTTRLPSTCPATDRPLTALVADRGNDFTTAADPTFWFYTPYTHQQHHYLEFSLFDARERQLIYRTAIELPDRPGMIHLKLPMPAGALQSGQTYRWYLNFDCDRLVNNGFDLFVSGWIKRVETDSQIAWYDAIDKIATQHFANPHNSEFNTAWSQMLTTLKAEQLIEAPLVDGRISATKDRLNQ